MFQQRRRQQNFGVYLLAYHLLQNEYIPPVTLGAILFQMAVFLGFVPPIGPWKTSRSFFYGAYNLSGFIHLYLLSRLSP